MKIKKEQIEVAVLEEAYKFSQQKGMTAVFPLFLGTKDWGVGKEDIERSVDSLCRKGWMEKKGVKTVGGQIVPVIRITVGGVDEYRRTHKDS
ncbi:hypothetical protein ES702_02691 [subsurface metagenome]